MPGMRLLPLILALSAPISVPASVPLSTRILHVETGLLSPVRVTNRPVERMDLETEMQSHQVPAVSIAVIHDGHLEWAKAYGVVSEGGARATTETLFQAASISKSVTTMAALQLVEAGKLALDAPIGSELKTWTLPQGKAGESNPVTLRKLLSHTAGTNVHGFGGYAAGSPVPTLTQVLEGVKPANSPAVVVDQVPGESFRYSGGGFCIVQQAILDATGVSFPTLLEHAVLVPLGMSHSTFETHRGRSAYLPGDGGRGSVDDTHRPGEVAG
jgi:CubicO group peptidase (beta-lactamase class C family)